MANPKFIIDPKFQATRPAHMTGKNPRHWLKAAYNTPIRNEARGYALAASAIAVMLATFAACWILWS